MRKTKEHINLYLQDVLKLIANINVFVIVVDLWVMGDEGVL